MVNGEAGRQTRVVEERGGDADSRLAFVLFCVVQLQLHVTKLILKKENQEVVSNVVQTILTVACEI